MEAQVETQLEARMAHPAMVVPDAMNSLQSLAKAIAKTGISKTTLELVNLRASQINGCAVCCLGHVRALKKLGDTDERLSTVAAWRESPFFTEAERAALALAESVTRLSDRSEPVSDEVWENAAKHYDETALSALLLAIASINVWNRLNAATKQVAGPEW